MNLKERYNKIVDAYIKAFEKQTGLELELKMANECFQFADYYISFSDIKYIVDNKISYETFAAWYDFIMVFHEKCNPNLNTYCKLEQDYKELNVYYTQNEFILYTLLNK